MPKNLPKNIYQQCCEHAVHNTIAFFRIWKVDLSIIITNECQSHAVFLFLRLLIIVTDQTRECYQTQKNFQIFVSHSTLTLELAFHLLIKIGLKNIKKTSQELRMLSTSSLLDCQSLTLNVTIQVSQFVSNSQLCQLSLSEVLQKSGYF